MSNPAKIRRRTLTAFERMQLEGARDPVKENPAASRGQDLRDRVNALRGQLFECEKICQWISSAVNTPDLPAGAWIYVDVARMTVLASMRAAQVLQLELERRSAIAPADRKG